MFRFARPASRAALRVVIAGVAATLLVTVLVSPLASGDEVTGSYDTLRTGWDSAEPGLSPSSVAATDFGQLFSAAVDGQVYAQPLSVAGMLIAATENNKVYGLDPVNGSTRWAVNLGPAWPAATLSCGDLTPTIGSTSAPVFDPATGSVYLTAKVNDGPDAQNPHWYLHALDAATGRERAGFPTTIAGTPTNSPLVPFNPLTAMQRPALLLLGGVVYMGFASHCDRTPYVGYVVGVNSSTGRQTTMWSTEAGKSDEAGIWQSGGGLVSDGPGRIEFATGNGVAPPPGPGDAPPVTLGESVVRLSVDGDGSLTARTFFSPRNNIQLNQDDADLGSGGPMALPANFGTAAHPHLLVQVGKDGRVVLLDADHMGGSGQGPGGGDNVVSMAGPFNGVWGHPAFWGGDGGYVYTVENGGPLRAMRYSGGAAPSLTSVGTTSGTFGYTSGSPVVTSSGSASGSALVWVVYSTGPNGAGAQLRAYDALPQNGVMHLRYSAPIGVAVKFAVPATDAGRVYVGTRDGHVLGFGRPTRLPLTAQPFGFGNVAVNSTGTGTVAVTATRAVTVTAIATAAPFGVTPPRLPVTLAAGQVLSVPVRFSPTRWGSPSGTLTFTTNVGTTALDLHGTGTQPGLGAEPTALDFGPVSTGGAKQLGVNIVNTGTQPEVITGVTLPTGPFRATTAPAAGTRLAAGASLVVPITYTPTDGSAAGNPDSGSLTVTGDAGSVVVPLRGVAVAGTPALTLTPTTLDFGEVAVGARATRTFDVTNTGTVPLIITKAKAPAGAFSSTNPLAEGQIIPPGDTIHQQVTFAPTSAAPAIAGYEITGNDGTAAHTVTLAGNTDPVGAYYQRLGGSRGSSLSDPVSGVYPTAGGGMAQDYRGGSIYWSPATGAHAVQGAILAEYKGLGGPAGVLGYPTTDETTTPDGVGRYNHFSGTGVASVYWTPGTGAHAIYGAIRARWAALGFERGPLGYPTTDETGTPDRVGRYNHFSGTGVASVYWTPGTGAHAIYGAIRARWAALGYENGPLGYPTTDEYAVPGGRRSDFVRGFITWTAANGAITVG